MKKRDFLMIFVLIGLLLLVSCATEEKAQESPHNHGSAPKATTSGKQNKGVENYSHSSSKEMSFLQALRSMTKPPKTLYGRVLDQDGKPVEGAVLRIDYYALSYKAMFFLDVKSKRAMTDKNGDWECRIPVHIENDGFPEIREINRYGIEWDYGKDPDHHESLNAAKWKAMWDANSPVNRHVNTVWVKREMSYLLKSEHCKIKMGLHEKRADCYVNLVRSIRCYELDRRQLLCLGYWDALEDSWPAYDLLFHVNRLSGGGGWEVEMHPYGRRAGILSWEGERRLSAPADGYLESFKRELKDGEECTLAFYVKTRDFPLYSEIQLNLYASKPGQDGSEGIHGGGNDIPAHWVNLHISRRVMNPFGKRCLQWDEGFDYVKTEAWQIVTKELSENRIPDEEALKKMRIIPDYTKKPLPK